MENGNASQIERERNVQLETGSAPPSSGIFWQHKFVFSFTLRPTTLVSGLMTSEPRKPETNRARGVVATLVAPNERL